MGCPPGWHVLGGRRIEFESFLPSQRSYRQGRDWAIRLPLVPTGALPLLSWVSSGKLFKFSKAFRVPFVKLGK